VKLGGAGRSGTGRLGAAVSASVNLGVEQSSIQLLLQQSIISSIQLLVEKASFSSIQDRHIKQELFASRKANIEGSILLSMNPASISVTQC